jgi:hypothetical protein
MGSSPGNSLLQKCRERLRTILHKIQSGWTLPRTLRKRELRAPGCFLEVIKDGTLGAERKIGK